MKIISLYWLRLFPVTEFLEDNIPLRSLYDVKECNLDVSFCTA
jgi:hypothetical protein